MDKFKKELLNAEIINRVVKSEKIIKAIKELETYSLNKRLWNLKKN